MTDELKKLTISTLNWLHHHGDDSIKKEVSAALVAIQRKPNKRVRR